MCRHKGEEKHANPGSRRRLGAAWVSDSAVQVRPGTAYRCAEAGRDPPVRGIEIVLEESPVGAHAANGHVEGAIRRVAAKLRYRLPISTSLRGSVAARTAGRPGSLHVPSRRRLLPVGECCMYMQARGTGGRAAKMDHRWRKASSSASRRGATRQPS